MIYLDNAATSCPKPPAVVTAVEHALTAVCANPGRGAYEDALEAGRLLLRARRALARLINAADESRVVFQPNATSGLNLAIKGLLARQGGHVVISSLEHNAVTRPLAALARDDVTVTRVPCAADGTTDPDDILAAVRSDTRLVALTHASNVLGTALPIEAVGPSLRERGVPLLVDAAQTAGSFPLDVQAMCVDLLALPGHKGLLGPMGIGALYVGPGMTLDTLVEGGAGGDSASAVAPTELPDRYEAGTQNVPGVAGLLAGTELVMAQGVAAIGARERALGDRLRRGLAEVRGVRVVGARPGTHAAPVVSVLVEGMTSAEVAFVLERAFDIASRAGLHCAPDAHQVAGTLDTGMVRLSVGHATTEDDVDAAVAALAEIAAKVSARQTGPT